MHHQVLSTRWHQSNSPSSESHSDHFKVTFQSWKVFSTFSSFYINYFTDLKPVEMIVCYWVKLRSLVPLQVCHLDQVPFHSLSSSYLCLLPPYSAALPDSVTVLHPSSSFSSTTVHYKPLPCLSLTILLPISLTVLLFFSNFFLWILSCTSFPVLPHSTIASPSPLSSVQIRHQIFVVFLTTVLSESSGYSSLAPRACLSSFLNSVQHSSNSTI